ncbi:hypothetical protein D3C73_1281420 [compost metagenome]
MDVEVAVAMRLARLGREHVRQPIVGRDLAGNVQDQAAQAVSLVGIGVDAPIALVQVFLHGAFHVDQLVAVECSGRGWDVRGEIVRKQHG